MKVIKGILAVVFVAFVVWAGASWIDITSDNCHPNPVHSEWNLFTLLGSKAHDSLRVVEAHAYDEHTLKDDKGNLWEFKDQEFDYDETYYLTIDKQNNVLMIG